MNLRAESINNFCSEEYESLPIQQNGRVKPLYVHAREVLKELTGEADIAGQSPVLTYCQLSFNGMGILDATAVNAKIEHVDLKKFLNLSKGETKINYEALLDQEQALKMEMRSQKDNESYRKALMKIVKDIGIYRDLKAGTNWLFAEEIQGKIDWQPLVVFLTEKKVIESKDRGDVNPFTSVLLKSKENFIKVEGNKYETELYYAKLHLANWALTFTILALISFILFKKNTAGIVLTLATIFVQLILVGLRVYISGRAPITNMYETVLSSGLGGLILAFALAQMQKQKMYFYLGLIYNFCSLMMLSFANGMLSGTISPLVPVLRDNFWLSTHVTTVILSYGALALSWVLANIVLIKKTFGNLEREDEKNFAQIIYTILKWGTTMLAAGIILGGVWADYSWGRFWGWDPKETWSLIVLCVYMAILHGRYTNWITTGNFFPITAMSFLSVMMAWFGVNYILATGLHSYGFSEGGALFLGSFFIIQTAFVIMALTKRKFAFVTDKK